jgi:nicotinamide-nucleotide amidase
VTTPEKILDRLRRQSKYLVVAESLTGGLLTARFAAIAGASDVLLTGIVAYDTRLKHELLGVSNQLLENQGPVDPEVAAQMADGLRSRIANKTGIDSDQIVAISTTGVAGPTTQGDKPVGELYIAVSQAGTTKVFAHQLAGERGQIQNSAVLLGVGHLWDEITG